MTQDEIGPTATVQIDRRSLQVFSQADIDGNRVYAGDKGNPTEKEADNGQG